MALEKIKAAFNKQHKRAADFLNQRCAKFSTRQLTLGLILFCIVFGTSIAFTIWHSFESFAGRQKQTQISVPKHIGTKDTLVPILLSRELFSIQRFRAYLDSLQHTSSGQKKLDNIRFHRPGLLDSLQLVEHFYQLNKKSNEK